MRLGKGKRKNVGTGLLCGENYYSAESIYCRQSLDWKPISSPCYLIPRGEDRVDDTPWSILYHDIENHDCDLTFNLTSYVYEMGSSIFAATSRLKFASTIRDSFTRIPSMERKKRRKIFPLLVAMLTLIVLLLFFYQYRSVPIGSFLWVSQFWCPSLTSMMELV